MPDIVLVEPSREFAREIAKYRQEFIDGGETRIQGSGALHSYPNIAVWLEHLRRRPALGGVPSSTYFSRRVGDGQLIGTVSVRHTLNAELEQLSGHIGYAVRPSARRRGYGERQLGLGLEKARELGIARVMVSCDKTNVGSARVIQKNGGVLTREEWNGQIGGILQVYWIENI